MSPLTRAHGSEGEEPTQTPCNRCQTKGAIELSDCQKSIISKLSATNVPPTINERSHLENAVAAAEQRASELSSQMQVLTLALEEARNAMDSTQQEIQEARRVLHPLRDLPLEILHEIFAACATPENNVCWSTTDSRCTVWRVARVCKRFREVAVLFQDMWSDLRVDWNSGPEEMKSRGQFGFHLITQLNRAQHRPRTVSLRSKHSIDAGDSLIALLSSTSQHWKSLDIRIPLHSFSVLHHLHAGLSALEVLHVSPHYLDFKNINPAYWVVLVYMMQFLPNLQSFSGDPVVFVSVLFPAREKVKIFRTQDIKSRRAGWFLALLELAKSLERCYIVDSVPGPKVDGEPLPTMVKAENLVTLSISEHLEGGVEDILDHLSAPRLRSLSVNGRVSLQSLHGLAERSDVLGESCLEELYIATPTFPTDSYQSLTSLFPNLRILELRCQEAFSEAILQTLLFPDDQELSEGNGVWPNLEVLRIGRVNALDSKTALEAMRFPTEMEDSLVLASRVSIARPWLKMVFLPPVQLTGVKPTRRRG